MLVAGNWKMNTDLAAAVRLASDVVRSAENGDVTVAVCPPFISLEAVAEIIRDTPIRLGAQNMHSAESGAFTGEVSAPMLVSVGCEYVILGHSERRTIFGETDKQVGEKVVAARKHGLIPIICVGETLEERDRGEEQQVVERQLRAAVADVSFDDPESVVIAYEPVWAIGTGRTASPEQAQDMHAGIRKLLEELLGDIASDVQILYGGSMNPGNAADLLAQPDINGGLIGGASLKAEDFAAIVTAGL